MNTFLPYADFQKSAQCLDNKRLGKQRVEAWQIYLTLKKGEYCTCPLCNGTAKPNKAQLRGKLGKLSSHCFRCNGKGKIKTAWYNHPIVQMWKGYELALLEYGLRISQEWKDKRI